MRRVRPSILLGALAMALLLGEGAALAKPSPAAKATSPAKAKSDPAADALLKKGVELRKKGKDAEALEAFRAAHAKAPSPRALAQIGLAEQALGRWLDADAHVAEALAAEADPWIEEHRATLEEALQKIRGHVGTIALSTNVPGARVFVDGVDAGPLGAPLRHVAGPAKLRVEADGHEPVELDVVVPANDTIAARAELRPLTPKPDPAELARREAEAARLRAEAERKANESPLRPYAWSALGGGALGLGVGVGALFVRNGHVSTYNDDATCLPPNGKTREENCAAERSAAESAQTIATIGLAAGGALAAAGIILFFVEGDQPKRHAVIGPGPGDLGVAITLEGW